MVLAAHVRNELDYSVPKWYKARLTSMIEQWFGFRKLNMTGRKTEAGDYRP